MSLARAEPHAATHPRSLLYRPLVPAVLAFAAGILVREWALVPRPAAWAIAAAAAVAFPAARVLARRRLALCALYTLLVSAGYARTDLAKAPLPGHHLARSFDRQPRLAKVRGVVRSDPQEYEFPAQRLAPEGSLLAESRHKTKFELAANAVRTGREWVAACGRVQVHLYDTPGELRYGDLAELVGTVRRPGRASNPGQLDFARLLRRRGIHLSMSVSEGNVEALDRHRGGPLRTVAYAARGWLRHRLREDLSASPDTGSLLCATVLGDRTKLDDELEETFKRSGTMHLLAISGLHVGIVAALVWMAASVMRVGRRASALLVLAAVGVYAVATGMPPSVQRAALMTAALVLSILGRRRFDPLHATALAALVLLALDPMELFHAGFQLSFAAVVSIICLTDELAAALRPSEPLAESLAASHGRPLRQRVPRWLRRRLPLAAGVSGAAWLGVLPLTAYYFHLFSPVTVAANLVAVPLLGVVLVLGFAHAGALLVGGTLAALPAVLAQGAAWLLTTVVDLAAKATPLWTYCTPPAVGWVVAYYALGLVVVSRRRIGLSGRRAAILAAGGLLVYALATFPPPRPDGLTATVLDVRHGTAVVLRYPDGTTVLYDCGSAGRSDVGQWVVAPALRHWRVRRIDLLVVSHADTDHVNGIPALLDRFPVGRVVYSRGVPRHPRGNRLIELLDERGVPHEAAWAGDRLVVGESHELEVLAPAGWTLRALEHDQNENSLVLRAEYEGRSILLPGDIQEAGTAALRGSSPDLRTDVLLVPHHGCGLDNGKAFAAAVRPDYALCSNRADHLCADTVEHYEDQEAEVLATCWHGAITVRMRGGSLEVSTFLPRSDGGKLRGEPGLSSRGEGPAAHPCRASSSLSTTRTTPSSSLPAVTTSAAPLTSYGALPMATPRPASRSIETSFSSSPMAAMADGPMPRASAMVSRAPHFEAPAAWNSRKSPRYFAELSRWQVVRPARRSRSLGRRASSSRRSAKVHTWRMGWGTSQARDSTTAKFPAFFAR